MIRNEEIILRTVEENLHIYLGLQTALVYLTEQQKTFQMYFCISSKESRPDSQPKAITEATKIVA